MNERELDRSMSKVKLALMTKSGTTFISSILFSLDLIWDNECETAYTNGKCIGINTDFWESLTTKQRMGLLCHETWHVAFNHIFRSSELNAEKYNRAADHVINLMLLSSGFELPPNGLYDQQYKDMSTEQVYALLPDDDSKYDCDIRETPDSDVTAAQTKVTSIIKRAAIRTRLENTKSYDMIPNDVKIMLDKLTNPVLPWQTILQNYMNSFASEDYTWARPNRRFMPEYYLPSLFSEAMGEICVAVDTSCSVSDDQFKKFLSEINYIKETLKPALTTIIDFDTKIHVVHKLGPEDTMQGVGFSGRGGTYLKPVFDYYNQNTPTVLIVFSDLDCRKIDKDPGYPVIWICCDNLKASVNFGTLIHFSTKK